MGEQANLALWPQLDCRHRKEFNVNKKLKKRPFHCYSEYYLSTPYTSIAKFWKEANSFNQV